MNDNFLTMKNNVGSNVQDSSSPMSIIIGRYVNEIYFDILRRINFENQNQDYSFTTSTKDNVLPSDFYKEIAVYDATNNINLTRSSQKKEIQENLSSISTSGTASSYAILLRPVRVDPSAAAAPSFVSSNNSDNTQTIQIRGISDNVEITETITLNGVTPVSAANDYSRYISISKDSDTLGKVTGTHGSDTIVVMAPQDRDYKVKILRLYSTPSSAITINCPYITKPQKLVNNNDVPLIECSDVIELGATSRAWQYKRQFLKSREFKKMYEQGIANLVWERENQPNEINNFYIGAYSRDTVGN